MKFTHSPDLCPLPDLHDKRLVPIWYLSASRKAKQEKHGEMSRIICSFSPLDHLLDFFSIWIPLVLHGKLINISF